MISDSGLTIAWSSGRSRSCGTETDTVPSCEENHGSSIADDLIMEIEGAEPDAHFEGSYFETIYKRLSSYRPKLNTMYVFLSAKNQSKILVVFERKKLSLLKRTSQEFSGVIFKVSFCISQESQYMMELRVVRIFAPAS